jgi:hypothetical protein
MKNQYVGDINDFVKYSVLRAVLQAHPMPLLVGWMLTADDTRTDGRKTSYLRDSARYRSADPELFDVLARLVDRNGRSVQAIEQAGILPGASFYNAYLSDAVSARTQFMVELWRHAEKHSLVFLDPDNGLDVASVRRGRVGSSRYLYCDELDYVLEAAAAVVIYQHFPRVPRASYVAAQLERLAEVLPGYSTHAIFSSHIALLAATPPMHSVGVAQGFQLAAERWNNRLTVITQPCYGD